LYCNAVKATFSKSTSMTNRQRQIDLQCCINGKDLFQLEEWRQNFWQGFVVSKTHTLYLSSSQMHTHFILLSLSLFSSQTHSFSFSFSLSLSHTHTHTHTHKHKHTHTQTHPLIHETNCFAKKAEVKADLIVKMIDFWINRHLSICLMKH
jgi:hypothetical protein